MKKYVLAIAILLTGTTCFTACDKDNNEPQKKEIEKQDPTDLDYSSTNSTSWLNYASLVAKLLQKDAKTLENAWAVQYLKNVDSQGNPLSYARIFKGEESFSKDENGNIGAGHFEYPNAIDAIEQIIDGCVEISNEVGENKIGDPLKKYRAGQKKEALYAVESWYSWHSRDDYRNNIYSIRNAMLGTRDGSNTNSDCIYNYVKGKNASLAETLLNAVNKAAESIHAIPQPFRNNIDSKEALAAQDACAALNEVLDKELRPWLRANADDAAYKKIITRYTDDVVVPTYKDLTAKNDALLNAVLKLKATPSNENFKAACTAWLEAREPWESSEAFLFGPVAKFGLDPNMDSWPLDQVSIVNILKTGDYSQLNWNPGESQKDIETAQNLRGFHTLEYLLFKNGQPRTVSK